MGSLPPTSTNAAFEPALGCHDCFALDECGGLYHPAGIDCLCYCCDKPDTCTYLCPRSKNFLAVWRDTNGITITTTSLRQDAQPLPNYIPLIQHGHRRTAPLHAPFAALTTFDVTRHDRRTNDMVRDPHAMRAKFQLEPAAGIILSSVAPDRELERYWRERHDRRLVEGITATNPTHIIAPNFSLFRDVPRFDNLANIKRSLLCAEEFSTAGLSVIPYLAGITAHDWERWAGFLREHHDITMVCKEFQTGPGASIIGAWHISRLQELQQRLARPLHILAIGGRRHLAQLHTFAHWTIIDSVPFMRTMHRRTLTPHGWQETPTPPTAPLDDLLAHNITAYDTIIVQCHQRTTLPRVAPRHAPSAHPDQLTLWPDHLPNASAGARKKTA